MIPITKGRRPSSSNSEYFRSIAISSILSKILDYNILNQQAHSLVTRDHQFGFKPNSSTVLCTTMLVEAVQYYDENGRQPVLRKQLGTKRYLLDSDLSGPVVPTSSRHVITHGLTKGNSIGVEIGTV